MTVSVVVPVLNSHEIVRRQIEHWRRIGIPDGMDVIYMDDGSDPPLKFDHGLDRFRIVPTNDFRPWTWALARNAGARIATGDYLLMCDVDYIITRDCVDRALAFTGDKLRFKRQFGILDEIGVESQDLDTLRRYGLDEARIQRKGLQMPPHPNNFCIRRELFWEMGGYREDRIGLPYGAAKEDNLFKRRWMEFVKDGRATESTYDDRPTLLMFPNGQFCADQNGRDVDYNPFGLFHTLSRKTDVNVAHVKIQKG